MPKRYACRSKRRIIQKKGARWPPLGWQSIFIGRGNERIQRRWWKVGSNKSTKKRSPCSYVFHIHSLVSLPSKVPKPFRLSEINPLPNLTMQPPRESNQAPLSLFQWRRTRSSNLATGNLPYAVPCFPESATKVSGTGTR